MSNSVANGLLWTAIAVFFGVTAVADERKQIDSASSYHEERGLLINVGEHPGHWPMPPAKQVFLVKTVMVPMRDGTKMATDLYFPPGDRTNLPVILRRTPYGKNVFWDENSPALPRYLAAHGYVVAVQDTRGRYESEGEFIPATHDVVDGYDTVDWLSKQPWSSGKVAGQGCSYSGYTQSLMMQDPHPALVATVPDGSGGAVGSARGRYSYFGARKGGAVEFVAGVGWFFGLGNGSKIFYRAPSELSREDYLNYSQAFSGSPSVGELDFGDLWSTLPVTEIPKKANAVPTDFLNLIARELNDPWWEQFHYFDDDAEFDVPALLVDGWFDGNVAETLLEHELFRTRAKSERSRDNQYVIISPMTHCLGDSATENTVLGELDAGDARFDYMGTYLAWYEYWLKGIENGVLDMPKVQYYLLGKNEWRSSEIWPLENLEYTNFYFDSEAGANSRSGDGVLSTELPLGAEHDVYSYDPADPVPSRGGALCCTATDRAVGGSFDQRDIEDRSDVLVYTTSELEQGVEVVGPIEAKLYVSSSARDTDFTVKLVDVHPDGKAFNVKEGILRARYHKGLADPELLTPGEVYSIVVDVQAAAYYFKPGHRIRVEVSSSSFPRFDRNLNIGGNNHEGAHGVVAENRVYHSRVRPSHIVLPVNRTPVD